MAERTTGWGFPANSRKAHWFVKGMALCRKWMFFGALTGDNGKSQDDCAACRRILDSTRKASKR